MSANASLLNLPSSIPLRIGEDGRPARKRSLTLSAFEDHAELLREVGHGNASLGFMLVMDAVRRSLAEAEAKPKPKRSSRSR